MEAEQQRLCMSQPLGLSSKLTLGYFNLIVLFHIIELAHMI